jgi:hypothetical protein
MLRIVVLAGSLVALAGVAFAADPWTGCYQHAYDAAALKNAPRAAFRFFSVQVLVKDTDVSLTTYPAIVKAAARAGAKTYSGNGVCILTEGKLDCQMDEDGGHLVLSKTADGLKADNPDSFYLREVGTTGADGDMEVKGDRDNRTFALQTAKPGACSGPLPR